MARRFYDTILGHWYNDALYTTPEAWREAVNYSVRKAHTTGEVLERVAGPLDTSEMLARGLGDVQEP